VVLRAAAARHAKGNPDLVTPLAAELFDYPLPPGLIAQEPAARRDQSRLLVVERASRSIQHRMFAELPALLRPGDILFRNNATVIPGRLRARRPTGGRVECLLLERIDSGPGGAQSAGECEIWRCLVKPGRKLQAGSVFSGSGNAFSGEIAEVEGDGVARVRFQTHGNEPMVAVACRCGEMPLPPYIERKDASHREEDRVRYQTVYADPARPVAAAAPTAGLHFTPELLADLNAKGVRSADLTLHVGLGTFRPIASPTIDGHRMHRETYELPVATQRALFPQGSGLPGRRVAVGTTSVRAIEDFLSTHDSPLRAAHIASTALFLRPPCAFRGIDAMITNFHQPRSTLLCLVAAFLAPGSTDGVSWIREIYAEAVARRYRFFSYGDAMLIL
jgi:S-adenosylmethionine:tRNA ribosyltransferase-isomerase